MQNPKLPKNPREADQSATWNMSSISNAFQSILSGTRKIKKKKKKNVSRNRTKLNTYEAKLDSQTWCDQERYSTFINSSCFSLM